MHSPADGDAGLLSIGEVAQRVGLRTSALRFYERQGLIWPAARVGGRRCYQPSVLRDLALIEAATGAGFTLAETQELLEVLNSGGSGSQRWDELATRKLDQLEESLRRIRTMQRLLRDGPFTVRRAGGSWGYPSPFAYRRGPGLAQMSLLFDTLVWKNAAGDPVPWLAESWEEHADGTAYRFVLRDDVHWPDGRPLSAEDVVFTFGYLTSGPATSADTIHRYGLEAVQTVTTEDTRTVVFHLAHPYVAFLDWVAGRVPIIPSYVWKGVADPATMGGPAATMGTGPYELQYCDPHAGRYHYTAKQRYFLGAPYVRQLQFVPVQDELQSLAEGEIDVAESISDAALPNQARLDEFGHPDYAKTISAGEWARTLYFNPQKGFPYDDRSFRHSIAHAINRQALVDHLLDGLAELGSAGALAPSHPLLAPELTDYEWDPVKAGNLLDDLGLLYRGDLRCLPGGRAFHPTLLTEADDPGAAERVARYLLEVGIEARVHRLPADLADKAAARGEYDLALIGHGALGGDPDLLRLQLSQGAQPKTRLRVHGYQNPTFELLANQQKKCLDFEGRTKLITQMQHVIADDLPILPLYVPHRVKIVATKRIFGSWYFTAGGVWGGFPGSLNKRALVSGTTPTPLSSAEQRPEAPHDGIDRSGLNG